MRREISMYVQILYLIMYVIYYVNVPLLDQLYPMVILVTITSVKKKKKILATITFCL